MALGFIEIGNNFLRLDSANSTFFTSLLNQPARDALPEFTLGFYYKARAWTTGEGQSNNTDKVRRKFIAWPVFFSNGYLNHTLTEISPQTKASGDNTVESPYFRNTWYSGAFHTVFASFETRESLGGTPIKDKWLFIASKGDLTTGTGSITVIDPEDGTVLDHQTVSNGRLLSDPIFDTVDNDIAGNTFNLSADSNHPNGSPVHTDWTVQVAEIDVWNDIKSTAELQAFAQVGFADINLNTNLQLSWNFMRNWEAVSGSKYQVLCATGDNNTGNFTGTIPTTSFMYTLDNPVPVFLLRSTDNEHDYTRFGVFTAATGTTKVSVYTSGTAQPSKADIFNGVGAVSQTTLTPDGVSEAFGDASGLTTGTDYVAYAVQDEFDLGSYGPVATTNFTTPTKYSEIITDVEGNIAANGLGIEWAWFDAQLPQNMNNPAASGIQESTDANGLLEITLPTSVATAKGSKGTMVLRAEWLSGESSAAHIVTVK